MAIGPRGSDPVWRVVLVGGIGAYLGLCIAVNTGSVRAGILDALVLILAALLVAWYVDRRRARRDVDPDSDGLDLLSRAHYYYELGRPRRDRDDDDAADGGAAERRRPGDVGDPAGPAAAGEHGGHDAAADPVNIWAAPS